MHTGPEKEKLNSYQWQSDSSDPISKSPKSMHRLSYAVLFLSLATLAMACALMFTSYGARKTQAAFQTTANTSLYSYPHVEATEGINMKVCGIIKDKIVADECAGTSDCEDYKKVCKEKLDAISGDAWHICETDNGIVLSSICHDFDSSFCASEKEKCFANDFRDASEMSDNVTVGDLPCEYCSELHFIMRGICNQFCKRSTQLVEATEGINMKVCGIIKDKVVFDKCAGTSDCEDYKEVCKEQLDAISGNAWHICETDNGIVITSICHDFKSSFCATEKEKCFANDFRDASEMSDDVTATDLPCEYCSELHFLMRGACHQFCKHSTHLAKSKDIDGISVKKCIISGNDIVKKHSVDCMNNSDCAEYKKHCLNEEDMISSDVAAHECISDNGIVIGYHCHNFKKEYCESEKEKCFANDPRSASDMPDNVSFDDIPCEWCDKLHSLTKASCHEKCDATYGNSNMCISECSIHNGRVNFSCSGCTDCDKRRQECHNSKTEKVNLLTVNSLQPCSSRCLNFNGQLQFSCSGCPDCAARRKECFDHPPRY